MKIKIKENILNIIALAILIFSVAFTSIEYMKWQKGNMQLSIEFYEQYCTLENPTISSDICQNIKLQSTNKFSFFYMLQSLINGSSKTFYSPLLAILLVVISTSYCATRYLRNRSITNEITRIGYKNSLKRFFKKSYASALIIPILYIVMFLICIIYTGHFAPNESELPNLLWSTSTVSNPIFFIVIYLLNIACLSIFYVNCVLCIVRKNHNFVIATIISVLFLIAVELSLEAIKGQILAKIFNIQIGVTMSVINFHSISDEYGILASLTFSVFIMTISFVGVYFLYRNKEKLIIDCEKNS